MAEHVQVQFAAPTAEEAGGLGRMVVEARLAACAQVAGPITSTYWWEDEVTTAAEWVCTLKTTTARLPELLGALRDAHSYQVPELVVTELTGGDPDYLQWVATETATAD